MSKPRSQQSRKVFNRVREELRKLNIEEQQQNDIELILDHFQFDLNKTINAFKNGTASEILNEWKSLTTRKQPQQDSRTSTPKKLLNDPASSKTVPKYTTASRKAPSEEIHPLLREKQPSLITYDQLTREHSQVPESDFVRSCVDR
ncbi:unnamed protein product [Didymodactylos carnosus]|uniref:Uncharacterized protein n=1 Tax=Didymodactylos carnosus TaxID=1234261 RepID=A0A815ZQN3_9BILA|nr:unnamed protein product [Didymodactylos carnosus]CAF4459310.1 unnamed protein product [Didymodactylos carnosus]